MINAKLMETDEDILKCFFLMKALRLTIKSPIVFLEKIKRQQQQGYKLLALFNNGYIVAIAGYRYMENFIHGEFVYIDDLVANPDFQGGQFGSILFNAVVEEAKINNIDKVVLDSALSNSLAHKFYYRQGMMAKTTHSSFDLPIAA